MVHMHACTKGSSQEYLKRVLNLADPYSAQLQIHLAEGTGNQSTGHEHSTPSNMDTIAEVIVNCKHSLFYHVRCSKTPSMKSGVYYVCTLLAVEGEVCSIKKATCEYAAG